MHRSALAHAVVVGATLVISCVVPPDAAANRVEVDFDSESAGGDGVAGQVIGAVTPGRAVVIATSESTHTTAIGGDSRTSSVLEIFGLGSEDQGHNRSAESAGGDGIATQIAGVGGSKSAAAVAAEDSEESLGALLLLDVAP